MSTPLYPLPGALQLTRRSFVLGTASFAAAVLLSGRARGAVAAAPKFSAYPFSLGVASGDPLPDGIVLWTRLAPQPLAPGGGMPAEPVEVSWTIADDEALGRVVQRGTAIASPDWAHSVHVEVSGLRPDRWYWYQFKVGSETSAKGRTRTAPPADAIPGKLPFAFVSCNNYEAGYYTAYEHLAREDVNLIVHLGDYIYEGAAYNPEAEKNKAKEDRPRRHNGGICHTLEDYRARYGLYKSDPAFQAAHAMAPWIVTWDDHEVANNYAGILPDSGPSTPRFMQRRAAGYQAYFEHMPLRRSQQPHGPDMLLHRRLAYGRLASFHVLDTRQFRTDQPAGDGTKPETELQLDPKGTIMGDAQREWLFTGLERSPATWNVLAQQVMMGHVDKVKGPEVGYSMDQWPGYEFERRRVVKHFGDRKIRNPVVLTGDIHTNWANELPADFEHPDAPSVGVEFVGTAISSGGDGNNDTAAAQWRYDENPCLKFFNAERGYVRCDLTPQQWRTDYKTVPYVTRPGAPLNTRASFVVESGQSKLQRA
jgi:alkaline phosphatase D